MKTNHLVAAVLLALLPGGAALAHPHGTMQCSMGVHFEAGRPVSMWGRLLMDAAHSREMQAMLRDPETGQPDAQRQQRFMFSLKMQLARSNWLLGAQAHGVAAQLTPAREPKLVLADDGRVGVDVALWIEPAAQAPAANSADVPTDVPADGQADGKANGTADLPADATWQFSCADPTRYWVTEFATPAAPLATTGCAAPVQSLAVTVATGARAGSVQVEMRCAR